jgi:biopolymer transport protein ExbB/biopolymer transport protein TolQ
MDLMEMWAQMGWVAKAVAFVLVFQSMWSFGVAIERYYTFAQARKQSKLYAPQVAKHLKEGRLKDALSVSQSKTYQYSHLAKVVLAGLQEYQFQADSGTAMSRDDLVDTVRRAIQRATALTANDLKKGIPALATIGATAPFVGLLGTTMGIVNAFAGMAASGSGGLAAIGAGIAEALITTAFGLLVAIPAVWAYNYFTVKIDNLTAEMTYVSKEMIDYLIKGVSGEFGRSRFTREFNTAVGTSGPVSQ